MLLFCLFASQAYARVPEPLTVAIDNGGFIVVYEYFGGNQILHTVYRNGRVFARAVYPFTSGLYQQMLRLAAGTTVIPPTPPANAATSAEFLARYRVGGGAFILATGIIFVTVNAPSNGDRWRRGESYYYLEPQNDGTFKLRFKDETTLGRRDVIGPQLPAWVPETLDNKTTIAPPPEPEEMDAEYDETLFGLQNLDFSFSDFVRPKSSLSFVEPFAGIRPGEPVSIELENIGYGGTQSLSFLLQDSYGDLLIDSSDCVLNGSNFLPPLEHCTLVIHSNGSYPNNYSTALTAFASNSLASDSILLFSQDQCGICERQDLPSDQWTSLSAYDCFYAAGDREPQSVLNWTPQALEICSLATSTPTPLVSQAPTQVEQDEPVIVVDAIPSLVPTGQPTVEISDLLTKTPSPSPIATVGEISTENSTPYETAAPIPTVPTAVSDDTVGLIGGEAPTPTGDDEDMSISAEPTQEPAAGDLQESEDAPPNAMPGL